MQRILSSVSNPAFGAGAPGGGRCEYLPVAFARLHAGQTTARRSGAKSQGGGQSASF
ncbi:MAG: hypothetical protein ABSB19_07355 [Methylomonas sp.]